MATHKAFRDFDVTDLEQHIISLGRLARVTLSLRDRLDKTLADLTLEQREATAAYKLATLNQKVSWKVPVRLGVTREELGLTELAHALSVTTTTVHNMVADGRLPPPRKDGRRLIFTRSEIDAWVSRTAAHHTNSATAPGSERSVCG